MKFFQLNIFEHPIKEFENREKQLLVMNEKLQNAALEYQKVIDIKENIEQLIQASQSMSQKLKEAVENQENKENNQEAE